jgi:hypothetical protein
LVKELAGLPDERASLLVFVPAGSFADEHDFGVFSAFTGHNFSAQAGDIAFMA